MCLSNWEGRYPAPREQQSSQRTGENLQKQSMKHTARSCSEHFSLFFTTLFHFSSLYVKPLLFSPARLKNQQQHKHKQPTYWLNHILCASRKNRIENLIEISLIIPHFGKFKCCSSKVTVSYKRNKRLYSTKGHCSLVLVWWLCTCVNPLPAPWFSLH